MLKTYRKRHREGRPEARKHFMQLDPMLYRFYGDRIRVSVKPRRFISIELNYGEYQKRFMDAWREGRLKTGEITVNENKIKRSIWRTRRNG
jgi:putative transposase